MHDSRLTAELSAADEIRDPLGSTAIGQRSRRSYLRYLGISALIGIGISILTGIGDDGLLHPVRLMIGAWVGVCVGAGATLGEWLVFRLYEPRVRWRLRLWSLVGFSLGGGLGYWTAGQLLVQLFDIVVDEASGTAALYASLFFGLFAAVIGLVLQTIELLRHRLEHSVALLKEAEFAAKELLTAREIQQRLLPPAEHTTVGYRLSAVNRPATVVAGDLYDYFEQGDGSLLVAVGDVAGKGLGASLIMATVKARLQMVLADQDLAHAVHELNEQLCRDLGPREFVALAVLRLRPADGRVEWVTAGLPSPLLVRRSSGAVSRVEELLSDGVRLPLGMSRSGGYLVGCAQLEVGDRVVVYSDGLPESLGPSGEPRGYDWWFEQVRAILSGSEDSAPADLVMRLAAEASTADGDGDAAPDDDCTVVLVERTACEVRESV